jgi:hypothetical protein
MFFLHRLELRFGNVVAEKAVSRDGAGFSSS